MKKNLFFVVVWVISLVITLTSCGSNGSQSSEGASDEEKKELIDNLNYRKACELKEFSTAYEIVDKLKKQTSDSKIAYDGSYAFREERLSEYKEAKKKSDEAERYVILQESMFVLESEGTNGLIRIVGIAKEHNAGRWLYSELLDVAMKIGDADLADRLQNIINSAVSESVITPETVNISGPLSAFFKIVDKEYSLLDNDDNDNNPRLDNDDNNCYYYIEFVRTKRGFPADYRWNIDLNINYLDENGNVVHKQSGSCSQEMFDSNVGDKTPIKFIVNQDIKAKKFTITSSK